MGGDNALKHITKILNIFLSQTKNCTQLINKLESKLYLLFKLMKSQSEV